MVVSLGNCLNNKLCWILGNSNTAIAVNIDVMHHPLTLTDREGMRLRHREIVHGLHLLNDFKRLDYAVATIQREDGIPGFEIAGYEPFSFSRIEGMVWRGFDDFAVDGQIGNRWVVVDIRVGDFIFPDFVRSMINSLTWRLLP